MGVGRFTVLALVAGCSFNLQGGVGPVDDASTDGARTDGAPDDALVDARPIDAAIDAPPDAPPDAPLPTTYQTLTIPGDGTVVSSTFIPLNGVTYHLRASGFVIVASGIQSDAEYWGFPNQMNDLTSDNTVDMGLAIDDSSVNTTSTAWGAYQSSHIYEITYVGTGQPLRAQYHDNFFGNNSGSMQLEIKP